MVEHEDLRPASVPYGDWAGTAAADGDMVKGTDLYTIVGLSHDDWFILAINIDASATGPDHVYAYAIDRRRTEAVTSTARRIRKPARDRSRSRRSCSTVSPSGTSPTA